MPCYILNREAIHLAALIVSNAQIVSSFGLGEGKGKVIYPQYWTSILQWTTTKASKGRVKANRPLIDS